MVDRTAMSLMCLEGETDINEERFGYEDEGIEDCPSTLDEIESCTPEIVAVSQSLCDSGYNETLNLQCLECVHETPSQPTAASGGVRKSRRIPCCDYEHQGFEDYVDDIYFHRLSKEDKYHVPHCLDNQSEVTPGIRSVLIQWLTIVHHDLGLCQDSLFLAVNIIDRVLDAMLVSRDCLELLAITSLLIATKENEVVTPEISELLDKCHDKYTHTQVKQLELIVLMATHFDLRPPTSQEFLEYYASFCMAPLTSNTYQLDKLRLARAMGRYLLELTLQEYEFSRYRPSLLAFCVWRKSLEFANMFNECLIPAGVTFPLQELEECQEEVGQLADNFQQSGSDVDVVFDKYANLYGCK